MTDHIYIMCSTFSSVRAAAADRMEGKVSSDEEYQPTEEHLEVIVPEATKKAANLGLPQKYDMDLADCKCRSVVIYTNTAEVCREVKVAVGKGKNCIVFENVTPSVLSQHIR